ncbi:uncharacterized protein LOC109725039 [Ananas comosus]|uniref:Uncharacterized protein LOC109725039 n=1 Tax=Ananas comosus TaxID=4615 RepID=A0A6P5GLW9_ANACO|nr:uncharacterized protein LOC109725039 [Ananas comosus]
MSIYILTPDGTSSFPINNRPLNSGVRYRCCMGSCFSSVTAAAAKSAIDVPRQPTAKVVAADGSLTEYAAPISASDALGGAASAEFFLCDSDRLCFGASIPALGPGDLLRRGQLYFVLPLALRGRALSGLDMAALAVKASAALDTAAAAAASSKKRGRRVMPVEDALVQHSYNDYDFYSTITVSASNSASNNYEKMMASKKKGSAGTPRAASRRLRRMLSTILEDAE